MEKRERALQTRLKMLRLGLAFFLALALPPELGAQGEWKQDWEKTLQAAQKEGRLNLYICSTCSVTANYERVLEEFRKEYPQIKVMTVAGSGAQLNAREMAERRAGKYLADIHSGGANGAFNVLYKDKSGRLGLIGKACPHRRISLEYGIPEQHGLRCVYHGWLWDERGRCLEQPAEPPGSAYKHKVRNVAYPVQELAGLIFAYLGPEPLPLLPGWDLLVRNDLVKEIIVQVVDCNWLQVMENSVDPYHTEYLHAMQTLYYRERLGLPVDRAPGGEPFLRHTKVGFDLYKHGIIKRRVLEGQTEEDDAWKIGHPILFPNILKVGSDGRYNFQFRTAVDDTHTYHVAYHARRPKPGEEPTLPDRVPMRQADIFDPVTGRFKVQSNRDLAQDIMAWVTAGPVMDRSQEHLADSDKGIIFFRKLLKEQMAIVAEGGDPMNVFRDPVEARYVEVKTEEDKYVARVPESGERVRYGAFGIFGGDEDMRGSETPPRQKA